MTRARIKLEGHAYYHCMARVISKLALLDEQAMEMFRRFMRKYAEFSGLRIMTYALLNTHWHLLIEVPERVEIDDEEFERRLNVLYEPREVQQTMQQIRDFRAEGLDECAEKIRQRYLYRMYDLSEFFKSLQWAMSRWYNRTHGRCGHFWNERFNSLPIEGSENALMATAAYIDLNPVRAGLVSDPKDYRFSGYGEAMGGGKAAREGLQAIVQVYDVYTPWPKTRSLYRKLLYTKGQRRTQDPINGKPGKPGFSLQQVQEVLNSGGTLPLAELLRCRVRYITHGVALGSREFVDQVIGKHGHRLRLKRTPHARSMHHADWGGLCTLRPLLTNPISAP